MWSSKMSLKSVKSPILFFWLLVYIIYTVTFYNRPHWNWSIISKDTDSWRVCNNSKIQNYLLVWLHLKISICEFRLILLVHITFILLRGHHQYLYSQNGTITWSVPGTAIYLPVGIDQLLNIESTLTKRWVSTQRVENITIINQKSTSQPQFNQQSTKFEVDITTLKTSWNWVEIWLIFRLRS